MQYNTYYRKEVWEKFKDEKQKSELVNLLLARHYDYYQVGTLIETLDNEDIDEAVIGPKDLRDKIKPQDDWAGPLMRDKKKGKL